MLPGVAPGRGDELHLEPLQAEGKGALWRGHNFLWAEGGGLPVDSTPTVPQRTPALAWEPFCLDLFAFYGPDFRDIVICTHVYRTRPGHGADWGLLNSLSFVIFNVGDCLYEYIGSYMLYGDFWLRHLGLILFKCTHFGGKQPNVTVTD